MFGWGKDDKKKDGATTTAPKTAESSATPNNQSPQLLGPQTQQSNPPVDDASLAKPASVFEFGQTVLVGSDMMRGVCTGEDPDAIQACTWSIEPAQGKPKEKKHAYRIEF